jgi:hypothetical protein
VNLRRLLSKKSFGSVLRVRLRRGDAVLEKETAIPAAPMEPAFRREKLWGTLRAEAKGNRIDVTSLGVASFEVLLGNGLTDAAKPVEVAVNGKVVHAAVVPVDPRFMLAQWLEDRDRSLVYTSRIRVEVE